MKELFQYEWKRYAFMFLLAVAVLVIHFLFFSGDNYLWYYGSSEEFVRWGAFYLSDYIYIFTNMGDLITLAVIYVLFEILNSVVKRKKQYHEFLRTIPIKRWKQTLFYYLADATVLIIPCVICSVVKWFWLNSRMQELQLSANWILRICINSIITHVIVTLFLLALYTMIKTVVASNVWKLPTSLAVLFLLSSIALMVGEAELGLDYPISHFYQELCNFENNNLYCVYDETLYESVMTDEKSSVGVSFGETYEKNIKEWVEKTYDVTTDENGKLYMGYAELTKEQLYKGEINPQIQILYKGEPIQKEYINLEIMEEDDIREARVNAQGLLEFDVNLCLLERYLDGFSWTYDIIRLLIAIIVMGSTCVMSGKCYAQKKGLYFKGVKYAFASIVGMFAYAGLIIVLEVNAVKSAILAIAIAAIAVWFMIPNRKQLLSKK